MTIPVIPTYSDWSFELINLTTGAIIGSFMPADVVDIKGTNLPGVTADRIESIDLTVRAESASATALHSNKLCMVRVVPYGLDAYASYGLVVKADTGYDERGRFDVTKVRVVGIEYLLNSREIYHWNGSAIVGIGVVATKADDLAKKLVRYCALAGTCATDADGNSRDWGWGTLAVAADAGECADALTVTIFGEKLYDCIKGLADKYGFVFELRPSISGGAVTFTFSTGLIGGTDRSYGNGAVTPVIINDIGGLIPSASRWRDTSDSITAMHRPGYGAVVLNADGITDIGRWEGLSKSEDATEMAVALEQSRYKEGYESAFSATTLNGSASWLEDFFTGDYVTHGNTRLEITPVKDRVAAVTWSFPDKRLHLEIRWGDRPPTFTQKGGRGKYVPPIIMWPKYDTPTYVGQTNAEGVETHAGVRTTVRATHVHRGVAQVAGADVVPTLGVLANLIAGKNISITAGAAPEVTVAGTGPAGASFAVPSIGFAAAAVEGVSPNVIRADATLKLIFAGDAGTAVPSGAGANTLTIKTTAGHGSFAAAGNAVTFTNIWARDSGGGLTWVKPTTVGDEIRNYDGTGISFRILSNGDVYGNAQSTGAPYHTFDVQDYDGWAHNWNLAGNLNSWFNYVGATASRIVWTHGPDGSGGYDTIYGRDLRIIDGEDPDAANIRARLDQTTGLTLNSGLDINIYSDVGVTLKVNVDGATGQVFVADTGGYYIVDGNVGMYETAGFLNIVTDQATLNLAPATDVHLRGGVDFKVYSDAGTTLKASIDGATGQGYFAGNVGIRQDPTAAYELTVKGDVYLPAKWKTGTGWAKSIVMESYATDSAYTTMIEAKYDYANRFNLKYGGTVFLGVYTTNVYLKTNTGVGTTTPRKALDVLATAAAQLRLTHTDDSVYTDFRTLDTGVLTIAPTGGMMTVNNVVNAVTGYRVNNAGTAGQVLMGNGTNIVLTAQSSIDHGSLGGLTDIADHPGYVTLDGTRALTAAWDAGGYNIRSLTFQSDVATGTAPFTVASTTVVTNLNADLCDGFSAQTATAANTIAVRDASQYIFAVRFASDATYYTAPANSTTSAVFAGNITMAAGKTVDGVDVGSHGHGLTYTSTDTSDNTNFTNRNIEGADTKTYFYTASDAAGTGAKWQTANLIDGTHHHHYDKSNTPTGAPA